MQTIGWRNLKASGEAYRRASLNFDRLETQPYEPEAVFKAADYEWPGDWEGRTILALVLLAQATRREPKHLAEIMERLPRHLNEKGYFGPVHPPGTVDEQQLSGNSWFLRAMAEHYLWRRDAFSLSVVERIAEHLLLPARGHYADYPVLPEQRVFEGEAIGALQKEQVGAWRLSTDIGCAFIMLDGATQAYQLLKMRELGELIDEMIAKFMTIDLAGLSFQTHATLSATRGLLRHYETTGDTSLLRKAEEVFGLYVREGMTATYANYNWFGRPDWTESCAVVDSFIVAATLWKHTGRPELLDAAHHIYYNGIGYGQRPNGGFGCDVCTGTRGETTIAPKSEGMFEAFWCCTMRGGEGLARAIEYGGFLKGNQVTVPFYSDGESRFETAAGRFSVRMRTEYPYDGLIRLEVTEGEATLPVEFRLYVPDWTDASAVRLTVDGRAVEATLSEGFARVEATPAAGMTIELAFPVALRAEEQPGDGEAGSFRSYRHGPLLLGLDGASLETGGREVVLERVGAAAYRIAALATGENAAGAPANGPASPEPPLLVPINDLIDKLPQEALTNRKQVLFA